MIHFTSEDGQPVCVAESRGIGVYLDNDSLIALAKARDAALRDRFVASIRRGATLLFSLANALEISGPQQGSALQVRAFLNSVGPYWIPLELNPWQVVRQEEERGAEQAAVSHRAVKAYFQDRAYDLSPGGSAIVDLSAESFFQLGSVLDWVNKDRDHVRADLRVLDEKLRERLGRIRAEFEKDKSSLDRSHPPIPYDQRRPGAFTLVHLERLLVTEAKAFQFKEHDGADFCHAMLGAAYGSIATLDKQWKARIDRLPKPNGLAKMFYKPELLDLVSTLEAAVTAATP